MNYYFSKAIQDGSLGPEVGRIVIWNEFITHSNGPSRDHNDLLRALVSKFRLPKDDVISNALRFYWKPCKDGIIISPVRKVDDNDFYARKDKYTKMIMGEIK
jgi:hypothetical protein